MSPGRALAVLQRSRREVSRLPAGENHLHALPLEKRRHSPGEIHGKFLLLIAPVGAKVCAARPMTRVKTDCIILHFDTSFKNDSLPFL